MASGEPGGLSHFGARKLLRTLSTVSIHESVEEHGGLAAMGPIGQAIIERRETAADAPASVMPKDFKPVQEEDEAAGADSSAKAESELKTARSAGAGGSEGFGRGPNSGKETPEKSSTPNSAAERERNLTGGSGSGPGTPSSKKKDKRFIIF